MLPGPSGPHHPASTGSSTGAWGPPTCPQVGTTTWSVLLPPKPPGFPAHQLSLLSEERVIRVNQPKTSALQGYFCLNVGYSHLMDVCFMTLVYLFPPERSRCFTIVPWKPLVLDSDVHLTGLRRPYFLQK